MATIRSYFIIFSVVLFLSTTVSTLGGDVTGISKGGVTLTRSGLHDPIGSVQGLISRILGPQYVNSFILQVIPQDPSGFDVYEISPTSNGTVIIRGNAGYVLSAGLNWYLKYTANCSVSWGRDGSGNQVNLPSPSSGLPQPTTTIRMVSNLKYRYAYNVCTYGYSMSFWNFTQFEEELDRLALWGINLPLAFQGQEYTGDRFWRSLGLNETEIGAWFSGPAFLPWNRMGNMQGWGGPLNPAWLSSQKTLQTQILTRMREFGMVPVLAGFAGHCPRALANHYPNANFTNSPDWCGFPPEYGSDALLEPTDPLFLQIGTTFHKMMLEDYGDPTNQETPVFNADMYNEMEPNSGDLTYLQQCNQFTYQAMANADSRAVYMMQAWLFHSDFWTFDRVQAYLAGVPNSSMIILDLNTEDSPVWNQYDSFFGHEWIWNSLITYGGRRGIYGHLDRLATQPYVDKNASATMCGVGFTPEATEMIPSQFDIIMEAGWRTTPVDPNVWFQQWAVRRYGGVSSSLSEAQTILASAAYNNAIDVASMEIYPTVEDGMSHNSNATGLLAALRLFVEAGQNNEINIQGGPYQYDLTDLHRQVLINLWSDAHSLLAGQYRNLPFSISHPYNDGYLVQLSMSNHPEFRYKGYQKNIESYAKYVTESTRQIKKVREQLARNELSSIYAHNIPRSPSFTNINITDSLVKITAFCNSLLLTLDTALGANINYLLGSWIADSAQWGNNDPDPTYTDLYVFNARTQITTWGIVHSEIPALNDYAAKNGWNNLVGTYYLPRTNILFDAMIVSAQNNVPINMTDYDNNITMFENNWQNLTNLRPPTVPNGMDPVTLAAQTLSTFTTFNPAEWNIFPNTSMATPPKSKIFVQVSSEGYAAISNDCPYLAHGNGSTLTDCEQSCLNYTGCTNINYSPTNYGGDCIFRSCLDPLHPTLSPITGYTVYGLNQTTGAVISHSWHTDLGVLATLCNIDPTGCLGFNSNGDLYNTVQDPIPSTGNTLYVRKPSST